MLIENVRTKNVLLMSFSEVRVNSKDGNPGLSRFLL